MHYTIFGSTGRIGSYLKKKLISDGNSVFSPSRKDYYLAHKNLGHVIYCSGVTSDFKFRSFDTIESHVCLLSFLLKNTNFESFNYLSSTRLNFPKRSYINKISPKFYGGCEIDIYNDSKLAGEALCTQSNISNVKVTRICHVVNPNDKKRENFLSDICGQAKRGEIILNSSLETKKNYIHIDDLIFLLRLIGPFGKKKFYNIGSNNLISNNEIIKKLVKITKCSVITSKDAQTILESKINISILKKEFHYKPTHKKLWLERVLKQLSR